MILVFGSAVILFALGLIIPVYAQGEYVIFPETASVSSSDLAPLNFMLKAISKQSGDVEKVSGFKIDPINVLSISEGGIISAVSADQSIVFEQAKAKSSSDSLFDLQKATIQGQQPQPNNGFSSTGLTPGVYTLDLVGTKNGAKAAYEGILVIGQNAESEQVKQVVEKEIIEVQQDPPVDIITIFQAPPAPSTTPAPQSDIPPDGTPCTGVDNVDIGVYKNGKCTPETLPPEPTSSSLPAPGLAAPRGTIPSCILTADCPPSPPPQTLAAQQPPQQQQTSAIPQGGQSPLTPALTPAPQALAAQPGQCQSGFEGIPPQCTPIQPGSEPTDLLSLNPSSLDPNDPLFGEPGGLGAETREGEGEENLEDTDGGDSESDFESSNNGGDGEEGDSGDNDSGDGGDNDSGGDRGEGGE